MKYIKTYESFNSSDKIEEGIFGNLWNKLFKNPKIDKLFDEYKDAAESFLNKKISTDKVVIDKEMSMKKSGSNPELESALKTSILASKKQSDIIEKQKDALKKKLEIDLKALVGDSDKLKKYAELKKAELSSTMLQNELDQYEKLGAGELESPEWESKIKNLTDNIKKSTDITKKLADDLSKAKQEDDSSISLDINFKYEYVNSKGDTIKVIILDLDPADRKADNNKVSDKDKVVKIKSDGGENEFFVKKSQLTKTDESVKEKSEEPAAEQQSAE